MAQAPNNSLVHRAVNAHTVINPAIFDRGGYAIFDRGGYAGYEVYCVEYLFCNLAPPLTRSADTRSTKTRKIGVVYIYSFIINVRYYLSRCF